MHGGSGCRVNNETPKALLPTCSESSPPRPSTKFIHYIKKLHNMNLGLCQMRSALSDIAASSSTPPASRPPSPPRPQPRAPTRAWPRWPRRTRLWRRWRRCFGRLVVDSAATSSVHIRSPCCTTVSCLFRNFRQHFLKRGYFAILDFQPYYNIACILYTVELYTTAQLYC